MSTSNGLNSFSCSFSLSSKYNKPMSIVENLFNIIAIAATKFNPEQLDFLLAQINQVKRQLVNSFIK